MEISALDSNLKQMERRYLASEAAQRAGALLDEWPAKKLEPLLRSHLLKGISGKETDRRDDIDQLLSAYSLFEVGMIAGCLPETLPESISVPARRRLSIPAVRRYYEYFYPLLLPSLLRMRLEGTTSYPTVHGASNHFMSFLQLSEALSSESVQQFLWFLDDGVTSDDDGDWCLGDLLEMLADPKRLVRSLEKKSQFGPLERAREGYTAFLGFSRSLDELLRSCHDPTLQSAFWHYHAYWFELLGGRLGGVLSYAIEQFRGWVGEGKAEDELRIKRTLEDMDRAQASLRRLTSSVYRAHLESMVLKEWQISTPKGS